jgi:hypothetical protein
MNLRPSDRAIAIAQEYPFTSDTVERVMVAAGHEELARKILDIACQHPGAAHLVLQTLDGWNERDRLSRMGRTDGEATRTSTAER